LTPLPLRAVLWHPPPRLRRKAQYPGKQKAERDVTNPWLKVATDFGPLLIFFGAYFRADIYTATAAFMIATVIGLAIQWIVARKLSPMPAFTAIVVFVLGGLTLLLQSPTFIYIKPTITNAVFAATLLICLAFNKLVWKYLFGEAFSLDDQGWRKLQFRWALFFAFLAVLNEVMWRGFSEEVWVTFKVWGVFPLTIAFALSQYPVLKGHSLEGSNAAGLTGKS
jgi:intracellular septation protein